MPIKNHDTHTVRMHCVTIEHDPVPGVSLRLVGPEWASSGLSFAHVWGHAEATGIEGAWVEHIQVTSGRSAAVESSTSESRVAAGVRGLSSQLCRCPLL